MVKGFKIETDAWYDTAAIRRELGITESAIKKSRDDGLLRFVKRGRRYLYLGEWLLAWLHSKEAR